MRVMSLPRARPRGFIMILVMTMLMVISVLAASVYSGADELLTSSSVMLGQKVASMRAELASQVALARIYSQELRADEIQRCNGPTGTELEVPGADCPTAVDINDASVTVAPRTGGRVSGNSTDDFLSGGGDRYQYWIYRPMRTDVNVNLAIVYAEGYYGNLNSPNVVTSAVEVEVLIPLNVSSEMGLSVDGSGYGDFMGGG